MTVGAQSTARALCLALILLSAPFAAANSFSSTPEAHRASTAILLSLLPSREMTKGVLAERDATKLDGRTAIPSGFVTASRSSMRCPLPPGSPERATKKTSGLLCHEGALGQWFPRAQARLLLKELTAGRAALSLQPKLEGRLALMSKVEAMLKKQVETERQIASQWKTVVRGQAERLGAKRAWYKSPALWFAAGLVCAVALGYGTAMLYEKTR